MQEAGGRCELFVVPGAGHVFNFLDEEQGKAAWEKTADFLAVHLKGGKLPNPAKPEPNKFSTQGGGHWTFRRHYEPGKASGVINPIESLKK
jgi:hypothetical protein